MAPLTPDRQYMFNLDWNVANISVLWLLNNDIDVIEICDPTELSTVAPAVTVTFNQRPLTTSGQF